MNIIESGHPIIYIKQLATNHCQMSIGIRKVMSFIKIITIFFLVDPKETDLKKLMFLDYVDTKKLDLVPATKKEVEFYKAVEHIFQYQEMQML